MALHSVYIITRSLGSHVSSGTMLYANISNQNIFALYWYVLLNDIRLIVSYLKMEHIRHCVPSNVSSVLASLPLKYVWVDGKENKSWPTDPYLSTGEPLNGKKAYSQIMSYFTTNAMTPVDVHELGKKQLDIYYPMVSYFRNQP